MISALALKNKTKKGGRENRKTQHVQPAFDRAAIIYINTIENNESRVAIRMSPNTGEVVQLFYLLPKRLLNLSILPSVSTSFCLPV